MRDAVGYWIGFWLGLTISLYVIGKRQVCLQAVKRIGDLNFECGELREAYRGI